MAANGPGESPPRLRAGHPFAPLRLLWWLCMAPERLVVHRQQFGEEAEQGAWAWLASTLLWLPCFTPMLALAWRAEGIDAPHLWLIALLGAWLLTGRLGAATLPTGGGVALLTACGVTVGVAMNPLGTSGGLALGVAFLAAFGVAFVLAGGVAFLVAGGKAVRGASAVAAGMAGGVACGVVLRAAIGGGILAGAAMLIGALLVAFATGGVALVVAGFLESALRQGKATRLTRALFLLLVVSHGFLSWFSFFGGWRLFGAT